MINYYKILEVPRLATQQAIKKAYRKKAFQYHPDKNSSPDAAERFLEIQEAYDILSDPKKRARYNTILTGSQFKRTVKRKKTASNKKTRNSWVKRQKQQSRKKASTYSNMNYEEYQTEANFYYKRIIYKTFFTFLIFISAIIILGLTAFIAYQVADEDSFPMTIGLVLFGLIPAGAFLSVKSDLLVDKYMNKKRKKKGNKSI